MNSTIYSLRGIEACYSEPGAATGAADACVLSIPTLDIARGSIVGLVGHNGSGKSTLLKILGFLLQPTTGELFFDGTLVDRAALRAGHLLRRRAVLLGQDTCLLKRSVSSNIAYGLRLRGLPVTENLIARALAQVGLSHADYSRRSWQRLSGGEARRVALAARLVLRPEVLLLDEPTAGLDRASTEHVKAAVLSARQNLGTTLVIVSHDMPWLTSCADTVLQMDEGRIVSSQNELGAS